MPSRRSLHFLSERKLWLHLDGNTLDSSNFGNNGVGTGITYESGHIGQCAIFNATTDKIVIDNENQFDFERDTPFTISMWFKLNDINRVRFFLSKQNNSTFDGISFWQNNNNNKITLQLVGTNTSNLISVYFTLTTTATWLNIVVTYDGSSNANGVKMYLNGELQTLTTSTNTLNTSIKNDIPVEIGNRAGTYNFNGDIDEVIVDSREWSPDEVLQYYNETA